jgi:hypothetical protein
MTFAFYARACVRVCIVPFVISLMRLALLSGSEAMAKTYTTSFPLTENPISEGGNWINGAAVGLDWNNVLTVNHTAEGAQNGSGNYDDSTALLTGTWGPSQTVSATIYATNQQSLFWAEAELRLRSSLSAHNCTGYEVLFSLFPDSRAYIQIVRWNGPFGDFTYISSTSGIDCVLTNGSVVQATITNSTITAYINGVEILAGEDSTYSTGNPGMGFDDMGASGVDGNWGFTSYTATDGVPPLHNAFRITPDGSPKVGSPYALTITAVDEYQNTVTSVTGDHSFTFAGLATAGDGRHPTITDKDGNEAELGTATTITFTNGVSSAGGTLLA